MGRKARDAVSGCVLMTVTNRHSAPADDVYDELLVLRCQEGDQDALDELVARWQRRLFDHARRLTQQTDAAWDVVQEAWMAIVRGIGRLQDPASFRPWAYRIVTFKCTEGSERLMTHDLHATTQSV